MGKRFRIEFDSINDVPDVYVDGKQVNKLPDLALKEVTIGWHTRDPDQHHNYLMIDWYQKNRERLYEHLITQKNGQEPKKIVAALTFGAAIADFKDALIKTFSENFLKNKK